VAGYLDALGSRVIAYDPYFSGDAGPVTLVDLETLMRKSDVVSIHARLTAETMLRLLADETGGVAAIQRNDFPAVLAEMEQDWKTYYSLGYPSQPKKGEKPRSVTVRSFSVSVISPGLSPPS
jgi:hypothetical protein